MRKWIALLLLLPGIGCSPKSDTAEVPDATGSSDSTEATKASTPSVAAEVAEAREYIDQALVYYDLTRTVSTTAAEQLANEAMLEKLTGSLKTWKSDIEERPLLAEFSVAANQNRIMADRQEELRVEFQRWFGSDSMNYEYQTQLDDAFKRYVEATDNDAHNETTALMAPYDDIDSMTMSYDLMTNASVAMAKTMKIYLAVMAEHGYDMGGSAEDGLFTELDLDYLNRFYNLQIEFADNFVPLVSALEEMTEAQKGWK